VSFDGTQPPAKRLRRTLTNTNAEGANPTSNEPAKKKPTGEKPASEGREKVNKAAKRERVSYER
jgi:hypothetical protein